MLVHMAIGDAYGAGFEFSSYNIIKKYNTGKTYTNHSKSRIPLGHYTDDTQMALALCELMLSGQDWTHKNIAKAFLGAFHRDKRKGYAQGFYTFLENTRTPQEFLKNIKPWSDKSGAAMRSAPLGYFSTISEVIGKTHIQASLTHNTYAGINSALAVALSSHYFIYNLGTKKDLIPFLSAYIPGYWNKTWNGPVSVLGMDCVKAALSVVQSSTSLTELLVNCVNFTGDTDTVACIAFGIASHCKEIQDDLSDSLYVDLENNLYGKDYLEGIDGQLKRSVFA